MSENTLAVNASAAAAISVDTACYVGRRGVIAILKFLGRLFGRLRLWHFRLKSKKNTGDDIAWLVIPGTISSCGNPALTFPGDNGSFLIDACTLVNHAGRAIILPCHLILPRKLNPDWFPDGL